MCGLCGILGGDEHWSDLLPEDVRQSRVATRRAERHQRIAYLNTVLAAFSCKVSDWQGGKYVLSTYTGKTELVDNPAQLWAAVERLTGAVPDPLSGRVLERLSASTQS